MSSSQSPSRRSSLRRTWRRTPRPLKMLVCITVAALLVTVIGYFLEDHEARPKSAPVATSHGHPRPVAA